MDLIFMIIVVVLFCHYLIKKKDEKSFRAPSPFPLPIIGHVHLMAKYPNESWKAFNEIQEKYGKIVELKLGVQKFLLVADVDAVKQILLTNGRKFANRPFLLTMDKMAPGIENAIHFSSWSNIHKQTRQIVSSHTLTSPNSKEIHNRYNEILIRNFEDLVDPLSSKNSGILCLNQISHLVGTVFLEHFWIESMKPDSKTFEQFLVAEYDYHEALVNGSAVDIFPFLDKLGFFPSKWRSLAEYLKKYMEHDAGLLKWKELMEQNIFLSSDGDKESENCLVESLIKYHLINPTEMPWTKCVITVLGLLMNIPNVANMTMACLGYLSLDLEAQQRIREEITGKIPSNVEIISPDQSTKIVQIKAAIMETLRLISSPYVPHHTIEDTLVNGYRVDKGTSVLVNVQYINHSPDLWESPLDFKPSRFLVPSENGSGSLIKKPSFFLPYGLGCRSCPGFGMFEIIAPFIVSNLLKRFRLSTNYTRHEMEMHGLCNFLAMKHGNFFSLSLNSWETSDYEGKV